MNTELSLQDWLNQEPLPEEIKSNTDGSRYIPIEFIKPKLDVLCDKNWDTLIFRHEMINMPDRSLYCTGSVELCVVFSYGQDEGVFYTERRLTGAATFDCQRYFPNTNFAAILLSLAIVNAAQNLGRFFGKHLNSHLLTIPVVAEIKPLDVDNKMLNTLKNISKKQIK